MRVYVNVLLFSMTMVLFACASRNIAPPTADRSPVAKPLRIEELALPTHPYISHTEIALYVSNTIIIEKLSRLLGLTSSPFLSFIEEVHVSVSKRGMAVVLRVDSITPMRKKKLLTSIHAYSLEEAERYWRHENEHGQINYFDIGYKNAIALFSFNPMSVETSLWEWTPYEYIATQQEKGLEAWMWSARVENVQRYEVEGFKIHSLGLVVLNYSSSVNPDIKTTFVFEYSGEKSARTTLRLLIPRLLESIDTSTNFSSLPHIVFSDNLLILEGLIVSNNVFWRHVDAVIELVGAQ